MLVRRIALFFVTMVAASFVYAKTIALVQINQQAQFFTDMNRGAEAEAANLGHKLVIFNANNDPAAQNNAIETYIQQKVDGLIVVAIDTNGIMPAVIQAANAGIPVVAFLHLDDATACRVCGSDCVSLPPTPRLL